MLVYEMDLLHFAGSFTKAKAKLKQLRDEYSVNVVWVMPPFQRFAGGPYATKDYFKIDTRLGSKAGAKEFVDEAHRLGLRVLFDITTVGHGCEHWTKSRDNLPPEDRELTTSDPHRPSRAWPDLCPFKYWTEPAKVISFFERIITYWITELDIDGYRCDTASGISIFYGSPQVEQQLWTTVISASKALKPDILFLAEAFRKDIYQEAGFDSMYGASLTTGWGGSAHKAQILINAIRGGNRYLELQEEIKLSLRMVPAGKKMMFYTTNHDLWAYDHGNPLSNFGSVEGSMRAWLVCLFSSGMIQLYNGQEIGTDQYLNFNTASRVSDIDWTRGSERVRSFYRKAGWLHTKYADLFVRGAHAWRSSDRVFGLVRAFGALRVGLFLGYAGPVNDLPLDVWSENGFSVRCSS
jgi:glycosidase